MYHTASSFQAMTLIGTGILVDNGGNDQFLGGEWSNAVGVLGPAVIVEGPGTKTYSSVQTVVPWADVYVGSNAEGYLGSGVIADAGGSDIVNTNACDGILPPAQILLCEALGNPSPECPIVV